MDLGHDLVTQMVVLLHIDFEASPKARQDLNKRIAAVHLLNASAPVVTRLLSSFVSPVPVLLDVSFTKSQMTTETQRCLPIEQTGQLPLLHESRLGLHTPLIVIANEPGIAAHTVRGPKLLIEHNLCPRSRQIMILISAVLTRATMVRVTWLLCPNEGSSVSRDTEKDLRWRNPLPDHVADSRVARDAGRIVVWRFGREELSLVAALLSPWPGEIVGHQVDIVKILAGLVEIDVLQCPFARRESARDEIARSWEGCAES